MARRTYIEEIQDPVTGEVHRIEAQTEAELDLLTEQHLEASDSNPEPTPPDPDEVPDAPAGPDDEPVDPDTPTNPA